MDTAHLTITPADQQMLKALFDGDQIYTNLYGIAVCPGYLEFPGALRRSLEMLAKEAVDPRWWTYLIVHKDDACLIGTGGFKGNPTSEGVVEVGYNIAPPYRNRGYATEAVQALVEIAFSDPKVNTVLAHTLPHRDASTRVLEKCGFDLHGFFQDAEEGTAWRWILKKADAEPEEDEDEEF